MRAGSGLGGDAALAAIFVAADPTSSPRTPRGRVIYGAGCGLLTWLARTAGGVPEGAWYAVLVMGMCVPLIDRLAGTGPERAAG